MIVPAGEFKAKCLKLMDKVKQNQEEVLITKHGKPIARLVPVAKPRPTGGVFGYMAGTVKIHGDIVSPIGETWNAER